MTPPDRRLNADRKSSCVASTSTSAWRSPGFERSGRGGAWANEPVVAELFDRHRGRFTVQPPWDCGSPGALTETERETIDIVLAHYGGIGRCRLSHLTHAEDPGRRAGGDIGPTARSSAEITPASLADYCGSLDTSEDAVDVDDIDWTDSIDG